LRDKLQNLKIYLSKARCNICLHPLDPECFWHLYNNNLALAFFSDKRFFVHTKLYAKQSNYPISAGARSFIGKSFGPDPGQHFQSRKVFSINKSRAFGRVVMIDVACKRCHNSLILEYNLDALGPVNEDKS
jgi:hypothetical protein